MTAQDFFPIMQLIGWCKYIGPACVQNFSGSIFKPAVMGALLQNGYIRPYSETYGYRLTPAGYRWLSAHSFPVLPDQHTQRPGRRFFNSAVTVTMFATGISPFHDAVADLRQGDCYLPASALRARHGQHVLGSNQLTGLLRLGNTMYAAHYPATSSGIVVSPKREHQCLDAMTLGAACFQSGFLFCGEGYASIYNKLLRDTEAPPKGKQKRTTYAQFYQQTHLPCYLLPCTRTGVLQLRMMRLPDYRKKLTKLIARDASALPASVMPACDCLDRDKQTPIRFVVDMELRGIERAAAQAKAAGYNRMILAGFPQQIKFLRRIFPPPFFFTAELSEDIGAMEIGGAAYAKDL